jgi:hypothetical protein
MNDEPLFGKAIDYQIADYPNHQFEHTIQIFVKEYL